MRIRLKASERTVACIHTRHWGAIVAEIEASMEKSFDFLELIDGRLIERYSEVISAGQEVAGRVWTFRLVTERRPSDFVARHLAAIVDTSDDAIIGKDLNSIRQATLCLSW
jgi:hypothetical protein